MLWVLQPGTLIQAYWPGSERLPKEVIVPKGGEGERMRERECVCVCVSVCLCVQRMGVTIYVFSDLYWLCCLFPCIPILCAFFCFIFSSWIYPGTLLGYYFLIAYIECVIIYKALFIPVVSQNTILGCFCGFKTISLKRFGLVRVFLPSRRLGLNSHQTPRP